MRVLAALILAGVLAAFGGSATAATPAPGLALTLEVHGAIDPASRDFILRGLAQAHERNAAIAILKLDTPGGLDSSMRDIIQAILASPVPVIGYVAPDGARAASAGVYLLYACHLAAMAPATNLGAATPVQLGGLPLPTPSSREPAKEPATPKSGEPSAAPSTTAPAPTDAMERKLINDARAYMRSLAQLRGRNAEWAEQAVTEAASLSARDALQQGVIDLVATDIPDLLRQADGRQVAVAGGNPTLATRSLTVETLEPDWRTRLLGMIAHPMTAYILLLIGVYGLIFELAHPGVAGTGGAGRHLPAAGAVRLSGDAGQRRRAGAVAAGAGVHDRRGVRAQLRRAGPGRNRRLRRWLAAAVGRNRPRLPNPARPDSRFRPGQRRAADRPGDAAGPPAPPARGQRRGATAGRGRRGHGRRSGTGLDSW